MIWLRAACTRTTALYESQTSVAAESSTAAAREGMV
jgi:hypothetical protein